MASIREFEKSLSPPSDKSDSPTEKSVARERERESEKAQMRSISEGGEVSPRLRHIEQQHQQHHGVGNPSPPSANEEHESSHFIDDDKIKMIQDKGRDAKKALKNVFQSGTSWNWMKWLMLLLGSIGSLLLVGLLTMFFARAFLPYPSHASCQSNITFINDQLLKTNPICDAVKSAFLRQMKEWESDENCKNGGMKCLYKVTHVRDDVIEGTHTTSDWFHFVDELKFKFEDTAKGDCFVRAFSRSTVPFAYWDFSVNYCNIRNLAEAVAGGEPSRFQEVTSDEVCTQYSSHDCEKY